MDFVQYWVPDFKNSFTEAAAKCCSGGSQRFLWMLSPVHGSVQAPALSQQWKAGPGSWGDPTGAPFSSQTITLLCFPCRPARSLSPVGPRGHAPGPRPEVATSSPVTLGADGLLFSKRAFQGFPWKSETDGLTNCSNTFL